MTDIRDPTALLRHATLVGDRRLVELLAPMVAGPSMGRSADSQRAYSTLVVRLSLGGPRNDDHS